MKASSDRFPALERLLSYGAIERSAKDPERESWQGELLSALGFGDLRNYPSAATTKAGLCGAVPCGSWWHVDPAMMEVSIDGLTIRAVGRWSSELLADLAPTFRRHLAQDGIDVEVAGTSMFLRSDVAFAATAVSLSSAHGRSLREALPQGADATTVRRLITELQMLLQQSAGDAAAANAVWIWGGGSVRALAPLELPLLYTNEGFAKGVYVVHNRLANCRPQPESYRSIVGDRVVVVMNVATTESARLLEARWFEPMLAALHRRELKSVELYLDGVRAHVEYSMWKRITARSRAVAEVLA